MTKSNKGFTLIELIVVITVIVILAAVAVPSYMSIIKKAESSMDIANAKIVTDAVTYAIADGVLEVNGTRLYNTVSKRSYTGTGGWFFADMKDYIITRVEPIAKEAHNKKNLNKKHYKYWFKIKDYNLTIYYKLANNTKVNISTVKLH